MGSTAPFTHRGVTLEAITTRVGPSSYEVTVPAGTACVRLDGGHDPWVVNDLRFIKDKGSLLYSDADMCGIHIPESKITDISPI